MSTATAGSSNPDRLARKLFMLTMLYVGLFLVIITIAISGSDGNRGSSDLARPIVQLVPGR